VNQNKNFTGGKPEMTYIIGGKDLLTIIKLCAKINFRTKSCKY